MYMWLLCSSLCLALGLSFSTVQAADPPGKVAHPSENGRTNITAQKTTLRNQENKVVFEGKVVLTKGVLVVHSDIMVVLLRPGQSEPSGAASNPKQDGPDKLPTISNRDVSIIEATGHVIIEKGTGRATCQKAIYYDKEQKVVLTGNPIAWQKGTRVSGKKITLFLEDDRSIVEGESRVMIEPESPAKR